MHRSLGWVALLALASWGCGKKAPERPPLGKMKLDLVTCADKPGEGQSIASAYCGDALRRFFSAHPDVRVADIFGISRNYWKQGYSGSGDDGIGLESGTTRLGVLDYTGDGPDRRAKDLELDVATCYAGVNDVEPERLRVKIPPGNKVFGPLACPAGVRLMMETKPDLRLVATVSLSELGKGTADQPSQVDKTWVESGTNRVLFVYIRGASN